MHRNMFAVEVFVKDALISIEQSQDNGCNDSIMLSSDQVLLLIEWLKEAKAEAEEQAG